MDTFIDIVKRNKVYIIIAAVSAIILALTLIFGDDSPHLTGNVFTIDTISDATYDEAALRKQPTTKADSISFLPANNESAVVDPSNESFTTINVQDLSTVPTDSYHFVMSNDGVHINPNLDSIIKRIAEDIKNKQTTQPTTKKKDEGDEKSDSEGEQTKTDPVEPTEPPEEEVLRCSVSISCSTVLNNMDKLDADKKDLIPMDGWILKPVTVEFEDGETLGDVMSRVCRENGIHLEYSFNPLYNSNYVEGIGNLYEFDCGSESGWMYSVNGWFPNYGYSKYTLRDNDTVEWKYTCNLGRDIGGSNH